jgi:hypothetical protein
MKRKVWAAGAAALAVLAQGCTAAGTAASPSLAAVTSPSSPVASNAYAASAAGARGKVKLSALPLDDYYYTNRPKAGWVYSCQQSFGGGGASQDGPWIDASANTFDLLHKPAVQGAVTWTSAFSASVTGATRTVTGNGLPSHATGIYPISASDPAYRYDRNPNSISSQNVADAIPADPKVAKTPSCANMGPIGVMLTGAQLYNALDAGGRDAVAHEVLDRCSGHPDQSGTYHYHSLSACASDPGTGHSHLLGYALDGFGIYGVRGTNGKTLTDADLDACHGHTHAISWNGKTVVMYHYHMTYEYPYSLGCYRGTPVRQGPGAP